MLLRAHVEIVLAATGYLISIVVRGEDCLICWPHVVLLAEAFNLGKHAETTLRRNETRDDLLRNILRGSS